MGFVYSIFGPCCDFCGQSKPEYNVTLIKCPYGYCQAWACCKFCKAEKKHLLCSIGNTGKTHLEICKPLQEQFDKHGPSMFDTEETKQLCEVLLR